MEHITITEIDENFVKLTPDEGYKLYNKATRTFHSEAVAKRENVNHYVAIQKAEGEE